jgi:hypothetical protein
MLFQGSHKTKHTEITNVNEIPLKYILKTKRRCTRRMKGNKRKGKITGRGGRSKFPVELMCDNSKIKGEMFSLGFCLTDSQFRYSSTEIHPLEKVHFLTTRHQEHRH